MTHDEKLEALRAEWERLKAEAEKTSAALTAALQASNEADRRAYRVELEILDMEGRNGCPRAEWIRCHLAGDNDGATLALAAMYPGSEGAQEEARRVRLARSAPARTLTVKLVNGIPLAALEPRHAP